MPFITEKGGQYKPGLYLDGMKKLTDLEYLKLNKFQALIYNLKLFFCAIPSWLKKLGKGIVQFFVNCWLSVKNGVVDIVTTFTKGNWAVKTSFLIFGFGNLYYGQILRGILFLLFEAVFFVYMFLPSGGLYWLEKGQWFQVGKTIGTEQGDFVYDPIYDLQKWQDGDDSVKVMLYGLLTIIFIIAFVATWRMQVKQCRICMDITASGKKIKSADEIVSSDEVVKTYEELVAGYGKLPGGFNALAPIIVPVILMALGTIGKQLGITGFALDLLSFLGTPIISLAVGTVFAVVQLALAGKMGDFYSITNDTLKTVGPILFVTAAGGVLGKVISSTTMVSFITEQAPGLMAMGIFFPFLLAAILKSAQGSSTVAITTTAGIMAPMMASLGLDTPVLAALTVMAIGAGAMTVSHANDSYFWVVTNFGDMTPDQGYKTQTLLTLVMGVASIIGIFILSLFF
mgnify:CR=1 FL=1